MLNSALKPLTENRRYLLLVVLFLLVIITFAGLIFFQNYKVHFTNNWVKFSKIVAVVNGKPLSKLDLEDYSKVQSLVLENSFFTTGVNGLKRAQAIKDEARQLNVYPTEDELNKWLQDKFSESSIEEENASNTNWRQAMELELAKEKVMDKLLTWREAEFLALRFDVLPKEVKDEEIDSYQDLSREVLTKVKTEFEQGGVVSELADSLKKDATVKKDFAVNAVQFSELSSNQVTRRTQRTVKYVGNVVAGSFENQELKIKAPNQSEPLSLQLHILEMSIPANELWCDASACHLIRIFAGNDGKYNNFQDWLVEKGL